MIQSSTTARMSLCLTILYSVPSHLTSVPEYLLVMTLSPTFTVIFTSFPSTSPPGPTATTSATWGFSFAEPARIIPLFVVSSASTDLTTTRSARFDFHDIHSSNPECLALICSECQLTIMIILISTVKIKYFFLCLQFFYISIKK